MNTLDRRTWFKGAGGGVIAALSSTVAKAADKIVAAGKEPPRRSFKPGEIWLDTAGKPIQAHAGSIIQVGPDFYWYGENKEFTNPKTAIWTWGVRCYKSQDLYNWTDLGLIIPPDETDPASPLHPTKAMLDRPHIVYHKGTKKFVCWVKIMGNNVQSRTVLTADAITGPYTIVGRDILPLDMSAGDFDLVISPDDGKAYMYFERVHSEMICADLTHDYTGFTGYYTTHFPSSGPPMVREGPAYFRRGNKHYLATSGTTGYFPNPSEIAVADTFHGPFAILGDLHPQDRSRTSYNSQICSIFKHPKKKDLYIALADRWNGPLSGPAFETGETSRRVQGIFGKLFSKPPGKVSKEDFAFLAATAPIKLDTSKARYVWLPIRFDGDRPYIDWVSEWTLDEFA